MNTPKLPVQSVAEPELALNETESILAQVQSDTTLYPEAWWPEEKTATSDALRSSTPLLPETYDVAQTAISPQALSYGSIITSGDGFRYGYFACTDPNGTQITLSDTITPAEIPLHTMQGSVIQGHSTANDKFIVTSDYHHAMVDSILITGGGDNSVTLESKSLHWDKYSIHSQEQLDSLATTNGHGFGMVNSSILAMDANEGVGIRIKGAVGGVVGSHSPGATSVATSDNSDGILIEGIYNAIHKASIHAGGGDDYVLLESLNGIPVSKSAVNLGDGNDTLEIMGLGWWTSENGYDVGFVNDSVILTGKGDDSITIYPSDGDFGKFYDYAILDSHFILGEGNDTLDLYAQNGGVMGNSSIILEDYSGNSGDKNIILDSTLLYYSSISTSVVD